MSDEAYKWFVIENICTMAASAAVVIAGFYFEFGLMSLFGLVILLNLNTGVSKG